MSVINAHLNQKTVTFSVCVNEGQDKLPTMYWLPKLHKRPNSSSCPPTTDLSKLLTSCLTIRHFSLLNVNAAGACGYDFVCDGRRLVRAYLRRRRGAI